MWGQEDVSVIFLFGVSTVSQTHFYLFVWVSHKNHQHKLYEPATISEHADLFPLRKATVCLAGTEALWCRSYKLELWSPGLEFLLYHFPTVWLQIRHLIFLSLGFLIWHGANYTLFFKGVSLGFNEIYKLLGAMPDTSVNTEWMLNILS